MCRACTATLLLALLSLALAGCGSRQFTVAPEHACGVSAFLELSNPGPAAVRLEGWVIRDDRGEHALPPLRLAPGTTLRIWRGAGQPDAANHYLAQPEATWQLANGHLTFEHPPRWPWDSIQAFFFGCQVDFGG